MADVAACLRDGYSTAGISGTGLGAMQRLSDFLEIYSTPNAGTVVHCRIDAGKRRSEHPLSRMESGVVVVPVSGETKCGDSWAEYLTETHSVYMVVDGLGHGVGAAEAADEAVASFHRLESVNPLDILDEARFAQDSRRRDERCIHRSQSREGAIRWRGKRRGDGDHSVQGAQHGLPQWNRWTFGSPYSGFHL